MANPGVGNKFVSVNLNKSYGQSSQPNPSYSGYGYRKARVGGYGGGGGSSGMVLISRPRSSNKAGSKLSVPPPLNLPSLRKEHEKLDPLGSSGGSVAGGALRSASRPNSSGTGWSKPSGVSLADNDRVGTGRPLSSGDANSGLKIMEGTAKHGDNSSYMPTSARLGVIGSDVPVLVPAEKNSVLVSEDFPSLWATMGAAANGPPQRQKDALYQKQRQMDNGDLSGSQQEGSQLSSCNDIHPKVQFTQHSVGNGHVASGVESSGLDSSRTLRPGQKREDFLSGPLPLVTLSPRSDWADDERDTGNAFLDRGRDNGYSHSEIYWDRNFDLPRSSILPNKTSQNVSDRWLRKINDAGKPLIDEISNSDFIRDVGKPQEGNLWRSSTTRVGMTVFEASMEKNIDRAKTTVNQEMRKDNKYIPPHILGDGLSTSAIAGKDLPFGGRDLVNGHGGRQQSSNSGGSFAGRMAERGMRDRYGSESSRYKTDLVQNNLVPKSSFSSISKGLPLNDPLLNFGKEKRSFPRGEKPYIEDPFLEDWVGSGFDGRDPLSGVLIGLVKRKKDINKEVDFHDPVRESFEAELERVQKLQEQERQRIIEEQERALEMAHREEEERKRLAEEQEERQRKLEEEARETAWRAEQERLEASRRAEEQRIAREEENHKMLAEEERRKQAAKQKLQELEERIARREAEQAKANSSDGAAYEKVPEVFREKDLSKVEDQGWEDTERMVERITNSSSSDSSSLNKSFDVSRVHSVRDGSHTFMERGKQSNSWIFENGNGSSVFSMDQDSGHYGPMQGAPFNGREFVQRDFTTGAGYIASRSQYRAGTPETNFGVFFHGKGSSWSVSGDDSLNIGDKIGDRVWGHGRPHGDFNSAFSDEVHQNVEQDECYTYGRSRYSLRQPRVLPPPSLASLHRTSFRSENQHAGSPAHEDIRKQRGLVQGVSAGPAFNNIHSEIQEHSDVVDHDNCTKMELNHSQSSLYVSSPPTSPTHLSHDDFNESGDAGVLSEPEETIKVSVSGNETLLLNSKAENVVSGSCSISHGDDEWNLENNEELQEQEEYDEDENDYHDKDEVRAEGENVSLNREFEGIHLEEKDSNNLTENLVLGFDQGVEVGMPSDESETNPRKKEFSYVLPEVSGGIVREQKSFEGRELYELDLNFSEITLHGNADNSRSSQQTVKETNDTVVQSMSVVSASQSMSSSEMRSNVSGQKAIKTAATVQTQSELPVKLQFGLFSGPSLIPSPVPSIQIGSIQMPLQLHPQVGPRFAHMHPPQPPMFQFGQITYPSPISQGISPLIPHSMTFVQPNIPSNYLNQKMDCQFSSESHRESHAEGVGKSHTLSHSFNNNHAYQKKTSLMNTTVKEVNFNHGGRSGESDTLLYRGPTEVLTAGGDESGLEAKNSMIEVRKELNALATPASLPRSDVSESHSQSAPYRESIYGVRDGWTADGQLPGSNRRKFALISRNRGQRSFHPFESLHNGSNGFKRKARRGSQRMEFRIRQSSDKRQASSVVLKKNSLLDDGSRSYNGNGQGLLPRGALEKEKVNERLDCMHETETSSLGQFHTQETDSKFKASEGLGKEAVKKGPDVSYCGDASLNRNITAEDDDAPLQSGVVRVFRQPGIEAPSDEDDFIEVRSKRQMLNDRREQREKEIKAKTFGVKQATRRPRSISQGRAVGRNTKKATSSAIDVPNVVISGHTMNRGVLSNDVSGELKNMALQPLAPIGTSSASCHSQDDTRTHSIKSAQAITLPASRQVECGSFLEAKNKIQDSAQASEGTWAQPLLDQQDIPLTQSQLDGAMKPAHFELPSSVNNNSNIELNISSSALGKDAAFSNAANPIYSLLAGEKIQFGAVTSPTMLPPSNRSASHGIGPPCPCRSDHEVTCNISVSKDEHAPFYEKDKQHTDSSLCLEECEAVAEAAASAVAAAAINSDEVAVTGLGTCSVSISDTKSFAHANITGTPGNLVAANQSKAEETLTVSLPADLSVETLPISLWPSLPSPRASSQMLSPFPGGSPSHFPFYDINPMIGGHIFAFGLHGESPHSQQQKSSESGSGPPGAWQHHSGIDSLYGSPAGFAGHFINPSGSIPGVQGPPRMVVYNHFAPVGQFGPVGLSYMGSTYIPPGKQPDWKHNPVSAAMGGGDGDPTNLNIISTQRNPPSLPPPPVHHLAPVSPLLSMPQPLAMFDVSQFQSSSDIPLQGHWTHIPPSHHSISQPIQPLQQQAEVLLPCPVSQGSSNSQPPGANIGNMFPKAQGVPTETGYDFPEQIDSEAAQFPVQHGLVVATRSAEAAASVCVASGSRAEDAGTGDLSVSIGSRRRIVRDSAAAATNKNHAQRQNHSPAQQPYHHPPNYNYQRERGSGTSARNRSGFDWTDRRMGLQGRNNSSSSDRGVPPAKVKQIYVVKQTTGTT